MLLLVLHSILKPATNHCILICSLSYLNVSSSTFFQLLCTMFVLLYVLSLTLKKEKWQEKACLFLHLFVAYVIPMLKLAFIYMSVERMPFFLLPAYVLRNVYNMQLMWVQALLTFLIISNIRFLCRRVIILEISFWKFSSQNCDWLRENVQFNCVVCW